MKIRTKVGAVGASLAMLSVLSLAAPAGASSAPPIDISNHTVQCNTAYGSVKFPVGLTLAGTTGTSFEDGVALKATLDGCVDLSDTSAVPFMKKTTFATTINHVDKNCLGLSGLSPAGTTFTPATLKWSRVDKQKVTPLTSVVQVNQTNGGEYASGTPAGDSDTWGGTYGMFQVGHDATHGATSNPSVTGAFTGGNSGHTSQADLVTSQDIIAELNFCSSTAGLKAVNIGLGDVILQ